MRRTLKLTGTVVTVAFSRAGNDIAPLCIMRIDTATTCQGGGRGDRQSKLSVGKGRRSAATSPKSSAIAHNADMYTNKAQEGGKRGKSQKRITK